VFWVSNHFCDIVSSFMATGLLKMRGVAGKEGWRWLFLIEGEYFFVLFDESPAKRAKQGSSLLSLVYPHSSSFRPLPPRPKPRGGLTDGSVNARKLSWLTASSVMIPVREACIIVKVFPGECCGIRSKTMMSVFISIHRPASLTFRIALANLSHRSH
jgi:hypothetical protein